MTLLPVPSARRSAILRRCRPLPRALALVVVWVLAACSGASPAQPGSDAALDAQSLPDAADAAVENDGGGYTCGDPGSLPRVPLGVFAVGDTRTGIALGLCTLNEGSFAAPLGSTLELEITPTGASGVTVAIAYPDDPSFDAPLVEVTAAATGVPETIPFTPPRSGEFVFLVRSVVPEHAQWYDLALRCTSGCDLETTRFPILLVHGWTGFDNIGPFDYFYQVPGALQAQGYPVEVAALDPYNSVEVRGGQLAGVVDDVLASQRARRINLIAHSQGGLDSRYLISSLGYGDRVSALTTIATPHQGTPIADAALGLLPEVTEDVLSPLLNFLGAVAAGSESDAQASFVSLSEDHVQNVFNPANPDDPRVSYISWTGRTCLYGMSCGDVCDIEIRWAYDILYVISGDNDGMVPVSSASWGDYRGEVPADHFDEVGQLLGVTNDNFNHLEFYLERAGDLTEEGH